MVGSTPNFNEVFLLRFLRVLRDKKKLLQLLQSLIVSSDSSEFGVWANCP